MRQPTICQRKRRGRISYFCELDGKQFGLGSDLEQAKVRFSELLNKHRTRQELVAPSGGTSAMGVRAVLLEFLEWHKHNSAAATYRFYAYAIIGDAKNGKSFVSFDQYLIESKQAELSVANFGPLIVDGWIKKHFKDQSANYQHNLIRCIQAAFNWAKQRPDMVRELRKNPLWPFTLKKPTQTPRKGYLKPEQWRKLTDTVESDSLSDLLTILKETGCRPVEARVVTADEFDRENRRWYFPKPPKKVPGVVEPRIVRLNDKAFAICQRLALKYPTGPLFCNDDGEPWKKNAINWRCKRLWKKLGFRFCAYNIRHTFCTDALKAGVDPLTVATLMGHKDATCVMEIYQQLNDEGNEGHLRDSLRKATG